MAFTKDSARKGSLVAEVTLDHADLTSGETLPIIDMPVGAVVDDCFMAVDALFDPTTSAVIEVGVSGATSTFIASQNVFTGQALGGRAGAATGKGYRFTASGAIAAKYTSGGGTATAGSVRVIVVYHLENQADFFQK